MKHSRRGFSLIELLVVISIIGLLSSIVLMSLNTARAKARDARRKVDIRQLVTAMYLYYSLKGDWMEAGSGCGSGGNGNGYFNYSNEGTLPYPYPKSIAQCLVDAKAASAVIVDPSGDVTPSVSGSTYGYMKETCVKADGKKHTYLFARLESVPLVGLEMQNTCPWASGNEDPSHNWATSYGMNYYQEIVD